MNPVTTEQRPGPKWDATLKMVVGVILFVLGALAFYTFRVVFVPLIIGGIIAYLLNPVARLIGRVTRLPHGIATGFLYLLILALIIPLGAVLAPVIVTQVRFLADEFIDFAESLRALPPESVIEFGVFTIEVEELLNEITSVLTDFATTLSREAVTLVFDAAEVILMVIFTLLIGFYLTRDADKAIDWLEGLIPPDYRKDIESVLHEIDLIWSAFFRGQLILAVVVGVMVTGISTAIGLPRPALMGVLAGLLEFLPSVGHTIWLIIALIIGALEGSTWIPVNHFIFLLIILGAQLVYTQIDLNFLIPRIIGGQIHLHPMVVIIGIIIGASVGGVLGVALAAPTIASARVIGRYIYAKLFDLEPFPMVGRPSDPSPERQAEAERLATIKSSGIPDTVIRRMLSRQSGDASDEYITDEYITSEGEQ